MAMPVSNVAKIARSAQSGARTEAAREGEQPHTGKQSRADDEHAAGAEHDRPDERREQQAQADEATAADGVRHADRAGLPIRHVRRELAEAVALDRLSASPGAARVAVAVGVEALEVLGVGPPAVTSPGCPPFVANLGLSRPATFKAFLAGQRLFRTAPFQVLVVRTVLHGQHAHELGREGSEVQRHQQQPQQQDHVVDGGLGLGDLAERVDAGQETILLNDRTTTVRPKLLSFRREGVEAGRGGRRTVPALRRFIVASRLAVVSRRASCSSRSGWRRRRSLVGSAGFGVPRARCDPRPCAR